MSGELPNSDCVEPVEEITPLPSTTPQETIIEVLQRDILGAEFLLALFWSAMSSFRHDSILRPFPSMFLEGAGVAEVGERSERSEREEQKKDIEGLVCSRVRVYVAICLYVGRRHPIQACIQHVEKGVQSTCKGEGAGGGGVKERGISAYFLASSDCSGHMTAWNVMHL